MDIAVLHKMTAWLECLAVSARYDRSPAAHRVDVTGTQSVVLAAVDFNAVPGEVPHHATGEQTMCSTGDMDGIRAAQFPGQARKAHPRHALPIYHGGVESGHLDRGVPWI